MKEKEGRRRKGRRKKSCKEVEKNKKDEKKDSRLAVSIVSECLLEA